METLTVGSLFSGIGGLENGLERTGKFRTIWQCEIEPYLSAVLAERFPGVPNLGDITKVRWEGVPRPDLICGGFPCQDISIAGKGAGIVKGARSSLWREFARCLCALRPRYALVENVSELANNGLWLVLADLAKIGYNAEWQIISAAECGAPHRRERLFIIANASSYGYSSAVQGSKRIDREGESGGLLKPAGSFMEKTDASHDNTRRSEQQENGLCAGRESAPPDAISLGNRQDAFGFAHKNDEDRPEIFIQKEPSFAEFKIFQEIRRIEDLRNRPDIPEPLICRARDGLSSRLDGYIWRERIKALGNAVVPACAEIAGRRIIKMEEMMR